MYPDHKFVLIKFEGGFVDIMIEVNPIYASEVWIENGKKGDVCSTPPCTLWVHGVGIIMVAIGFCTYDIYKVSESESLRI